MAMKRIASWLAILTASLAVGAAGAQQYPSKPVKIIVGFAPGGGSDFIARVIAQKLTERMGTQVIVENRPGAGSVLGSEFAIKSPADGYTLQLSRGPYVVAVHPSVQAKTLQELVALAKRDPDKLAYASSGNGSHVHVATEYFLYTAGIKITHVPYKGTGPALNDTIAGTTQLIFGSVATALQHVKSGRLRALAVTTPKRIPAAADVPTVAEAGYPAYEVTNWHGLVGPKGLSKDIVERLNKEANEALKSKDVEKVLASDGLEHAGGSAGEFTVILKNEVARWGQVVRQAKVKVD